MQSVTAQSPSFLRDINLGLRDHLRTLKADINQREAKEMAIAVAVVAGLIWSATIGFEAGQANPDTKNIFTSIAEKNQ